jgi:hypothetical protein
VAAIKQLIHSCLRVCHFRSTLQLLDAILTTGDLDDQLAALQSTSNRGCVDMNTLDMTTTAMREHGAMRELSATELDQVSGGQSTESILDKRPTAAVQPRWYSELAPRSADDAKHCCATVAAGFVFLTTKIRFADARIGRDFFENDLKFWNGETRSIRGSKNSRHEILFLKTIKQIF